MRPAIMSKAAWQLEAAENNADLYQHMFEVHGIPYERSKELFHTIVLPLPFYSSIVTCLPTTKSKLINNLTRTATFDVYVKDSFAVLPLEQSGFKKLFDASWFYLTEIVKADTVGWEQIKTARQLEHWRQHGRQAAIRQTAACFHLHFSRTRTLPFGAMLKRESTPRASSATGLAAQSAFPTSLQAHCPQKTSSKWRACCRHGNHQHQ
ncbi:hypothetical protein [Pseudovibrio sp. Ad37]|uniref:hypothetical protein n=1 Tax=Pseudovibrio sp. Ad37 TaxID=989422 RepID=UPI0007B2E62E|nr:hypothetical protein [Pseudovibrio sp. Ad37]KZL23502.1 hypothetical protein PsAD37_03115 [Pseudovibrio sp. Ad37]